MELTDAVWNEMEGYTNNPRLEVAVDSMPERDDARFRGYPIGNKYLYVGESGGRVWFYSWSGDGNDGGFSGRCYEVNMEDGTTEVLKGPYSSRAGIVNKYTDTDCVKVHQIEGSGLLHVTKELAQEAAELAGKELVRTEKFEDEIYYRFE
jgi:hypothetical protein